MSLIQIFIASVGLSLLLLISLRLGDIATKLEQIVKHLQREQQ